MAKPHDEFTKNRAQRQKKIRKRRLLLGFWAFIVTALIVTVVLSLTVLFPIKHVTASGSALYTGSQIVKATGINEKCNLFTLSEEIVESNIRSVLPYVDSIEMERVFPDTIKITALDAKEYACYLYKENYYAVSENGYVLNCYSEPPENTFVIECGKITCKIGKEIEFADDVDRQQVDNLVKALEDKDITIDSISTADPYNLTATVDGRFEVKFGSSTDLENKVAHLAGMIEKIEEGRSGKIDVSMWTSNKKEGSFSENKAE